MSSDERTRPRLVDVAREAGVSVSTASRALGRGSDLIRVDTRDHVREVARRLGYRVNPVARSLRLAQTGQIGMVVPSISNPFFMELVVQVEHALAERGMSLLLCDSRMSVSNEDYVLRGFESGAVDGLIIVPCHEIYSTPAVERTSGLVPTVQLDRAARLPGLPMVGVDDRHGIRLVLDHLRARGARRLAMLSNTGSDVSSVTRVEEARTAAADFGMRLDDADVIECSFSVDSARSAIASLMSRGDHWDAVVCLNDLIAIGAITELRSRGLRIPEDVMVTGFDDIQFAQLMRPSITTLRQPVARIARRGVDLLLAAQDPAGRSHRPGPAVEGQGTRIVVPGELVVRESTGP
ncbi:LacI family transcriptional regulator [Actinomyces sp. B33]|uniref:LacI family DNA-binding transcriptional regulator n=1 Tax=Actinomyces sp. B33 TaxID=2942131 RepID=UPI00234115DA|nr:LacI family DNA-binding transcriptional regulator [Actinomyces sp. B33]MDC4232513.1 LacI family transcriptional regulator [Actinomyces sp. B33]